MSYDGSSARRARRSTLRLLIGLHRRTEDPSYESPRPFESMQPVLLYSVYLGLILSVFGLGWLYVAALRYERRWFIRMCIFPPLALGFLRKAPSHAKWPFLTLFLGLCFLTAPAAYTHWMPVDLGEHERRVDGKVVVTLTGWDRKDYSFLKQRPDIVILQMANEDVTDETLGFLAESKNLQELDVSHSAITDAGLAVLQKLPDLEKLHVVKTAVTDAGVNAHLTPHPKLKQLDVSQTAVTKGALKKFKEQFQGRRTVGGQADPLPPQTQTESPQ